MISYVYLEDYLNLYEYIIKQMVPFGKRGMVYLVTFIYRRMKCKIKEEWNTKAFAVTFKLEIDKEILITKAIKDINKSKSDLVVANILQIRYSTLYIIDSSENEEVIEKGKGDEHIEAMLVSDIIEKHSKYINESWW